MQAEDMDFVWAEMLRYWHQTGQLDPAQAATYAGLADEGEFRTLGWDISYDQPMPLDPQSGSDAPWHLWVPWPVTDADSAETWYGDQAAALHGFGADPISAWGVAA